MPPVTARCRHGQVNASSLSAITLDDNRCADPACMSLHATEAEMPRSSMDACLLIHSTSVIFDGDLDGIFTENDTHFNDAGIRMAKCIRQSLTANAVDFVAH